MAKNNPRGLVASRTMGSNVPARQKQYPTGARNLTQIFTGDLVFLDANGEVQSFTGVSADARPALGVVAHVLDSNRKPMTHSLPTKAAFLDASTAGFVSVYDDPDTVFVVHSSAAVTQANTGSFTTVTANSPNSAAGISGQMMGAIVATAAGHPLQILGISEEETETTAGGGIANNDVEVKISNHLFRRSARLIPAVE